MAYYATSPKALAGDPIPENPAWGSLADSAIYRYDAFGNVREIQGAFSENSPWRLSTKYWDEETGLSYYGYRYYDPVTGRWPSRDPIEEEGGVNLYGFVGNDGLNWWDFLGMEAGVAYSTYEESKEAATPLLSKKGWDSWKSGKAGLNTKKTWFKHKSGKRAHWAVYDTVASKKRWAAAGIEYFTWNYCLDGEFYHTEIFAGEFPDNPFTEGGGISAKASLKALQSIPEGGVVVGLGHTHIVQWFEMTKEGVKLAPQEVGLSGGDRSGAEAGGYKICVIEMDGNVYCEKCSP